MADNEKKVTQGSEVEKAATEESKAASKVAKAAKGNKKSKKSVTGGWEKTKKFFKDYRGERKKIVWPDAKMVLKSTGVVILVVAIVSLIIFGIDQGLSAGITGLKKLATNEDTTVSQVDESKDTEDSKDDSKDESKKDDSEEETTKKKSDKKKTESETTEAESTENTAE